MEKVFIGYPTNGTTRATFTKSLTDLAIFECKSPNERYEIINPDFTESIYISENRNELVYKAREAGADWILSLDCDNQFSQVLLRLMMRSAHPVQRPVIFGLYANVGRVDTDGRWEILDCIYGETEDGTYRNLIPDGSTEPFQIDAAGSGVFLAHMSVFAKYQYPWFFTPYFSREEGGNMQFMNEDLAWCRTLRDLGVPIFVDPVVEVTHWKTIPLISSQYRLLYEKAMEVKRNMEANNAKPKRSKRN